MRRLMRWSPVVVGIALLANAQALAQTSSELRQDELVARPDTLRGEIDTNGDATTGQGPVWELAGGYGLRTFPEVRWGRWLGSAGIRARRHLWVVGEASRWGFRIPYFDHGWIGFLGGLRYERQFGRVAPFAQLLTGIERLSVTEVDIVSLADPPEGRVRLPKLSFRGASFWVVRAGGGVDVRLAGRAAIRLTVDYGSLTRRWFRSWRITPSLVVGIGR